MNSLGAGNMVSKFVKHVKRAKTVTESDRGQSCVFHLKFIYKYVSGFDNIFFFKTLATRVQLGLSPLRK